MKNLIIIGLFVCSILNGQNLLLNHNRGRVIMLTGGEAPWYSNWTTSNVVYEGHSFYVESSNALATYTTTYTNADSVYNSAIGGSVVSECISRASVVDSKLMVENDTLKNILLLYIGANDLLLEGSADLRYPFLKTYVQDRVSAGWKVFLYTTTPSTETARSEYFEAERDIWNDSIRNNLSKIINVYIIETDTIIRLSDPTNTEYYRDELHPTTTGLKILADLFRDKVRTLSSNAIVEDSEFQLTFQSIQPATLDQVSITLRTSSATDTVYVDWGDGSTSKVSGYYSVGVTSSYLTNNTTYDITISSTDILTRCYIHDEPTVSGIDIDQLSVCKILTSLGLVDLTGDGIGSIDNLPNSIQYLTFTNLGNSITGTLSNLSPNLLTTSLSNTPNVNITNGIMPSWDTNNISLKFTSYSTSDIDGFLNKYAATAGNGTATIDLRNTNPRSSLSDAAVTTLEGLGKTILTDPIWQFDITGSSISEIISATDTITIDWGDGNTDSYVGANQTISHTYASSDTYTVKFYGDESSFTRINFNDNLNYSFDLSSIPSGNTYFYVGSSNTISGNLSSIPSGNTYFVVTGSNTISGNLSSIPSGNTVFFVDGSNTILGNLSSIPSGNTYFSVTGSNTISGNLSSIPSGNTYFSVTGSNTISGNLSSIPSSNTYFRAEGSNTVTGNLSSIPSGNTYFVVTGSNTISDYTTKTWTTKPSRFIIIGNASLSTAELDQLLIDLDADLTWSSGDVITITGNSDARSSASDAAVSNMTSEGATITTN